MNSDAQDESEALDSEMLGDEYPPEAPLGVNEYGTTPAEERVDEPLEDRVARETPDILVPKPEQITLVEDPDSGDEKEMLGTEATQDPRVVELDGDDPSERLGDASMPAEEQAIHRER